MVCRLEPGAILLIERVAERAGEAKRQVVKQVLGRARSSLRGVTIATGVGGVSRAKAWAPCVAAGRRPRAISARQERAGRSARVCEKEQRLWSLTRLRC